MECDHLTIAHLRDMIKNLEADRDKIAIESERAIIRKFVDALNSALKADVDSVGQFVASGLFHVLNDACGGCVGILRTQDGLVSCFVAIEHEKESNRKSPETHAEGDAQKKIQGKEEK